MNKSKRKNKMEKIQKWNKFQQKNKNVHETHMQMTIEKINW